MRQLFTATFLALALGAGAQTQVTTAELRGLYKTDMGVQPISIHDPSIVYAPTQKRYYCIGSHMAMGWSSDLMNWNSLYWEATDSKMWGKTDEAGKVVACSYDEAYTTSATTSVRALVNGAVKEVPFGPFNAKSWGEAFRGNGGSVVGNQWAPDMVWNDVMKKWCVYQSVNADSWKSVIVLMTSDKPTGPFVCQGPVVYSGFSTAFDRDGSTYKDTDLELVLGTQSTLPARYEKGDATWGEKWGDYWPNNIDPCTFYDEEGVLWMAYGSWSGGIWMLRLDPTTGLRDYTVTYPSDFSAKGKSCTSDPYFGHRIAGGHYVSGEGPYIQHIGNHYFLFMSYGGFAPDGGYEMRVFRSDKPEGPYTDPAGNAATYTSYQLNYGPTSATNRGARLMGAYRWDFMTKGECAQGHNSACVDDRGRAFVVYHTKFNDGTIGHSLRVHQLFLNAEGWLVAAPFQYRGETVNQDSIATRERWSNDDICGEYQLLTHRYKMDHANYAETAPVAITLSADGKVKGDVTGTWSRTTGTDYISLRLGSTTYSGVLVEQCMEPSNIRALCFTALSSTTGECVWGAKMQPRYALAYIMNNKTWDVSDGKSVSSHIAIMSDLPYGTTMQWQSSEPDIISTTGKYNPTDEAVPVDLTVTLTCPPYYWTTTYGVTARPATTYTGDYLTGLRAYYNFDETDGKYVNAYNTAQTATLYAKSGYTAVKPVVTTDYDRIGGVARTHQSAAGNAYVRLPNPLKDATLTDGFTVAMWVKRLDDNAWDNLFAFASTLLTTGGKHFYVNGNGYVGFNDGAGNWFDANHPTAFTSSLIPVGEWTWVALTYSRQNGVRLLVGGNNKRFTGTTGTWASAPEAKYNAYDYSLIEPTVTSSSYIYIGSGSFWGSANVMYDEVMVYDRELSTTDITTLRGMLSRVTDFTKGEGGTLVAAPRCTTAPTGMFDLQGRPLTSAPQQGLYVKDGKVVVMHN